MRIFLLIYISFYSARFGLFTRHRMAPVAFKLPQTISQFALVFAPSVVRSQQYKILSFKKLIEFSWIANSVM